MRFQDETTRPREPTLAERKAREQAERRQREAAEQAEADAERSRTRRKRILIGGGRHGRARRRHRHRLRDRPARRRGDRALRRRQRRGRRRRQLRHPRRVERHATTTAAASTRSSSAPAGRSTTTTTAAAGRSGSPSPAAPPPCPATRRSVTTVVRARLCRARGSERKVTRGGLGLVLAADRAAEADGTPPRGAAAGLGEDRRGPGDGLRHPGPRRGRGRAPVLGRVGALHVLDGRGALPRGRRRGRALDVP